MVSLFFNSVSLLIPQKSACMNDETGLAATSVPVKISGALFTLLMGSCQRASFDL